MRKEKKYRNEQGEGKRKRKTGNRKNGRRLKGYICQKSRNIDDDKTEGKGMTEK